MGDGAGPAGGVDRCGGAGRHTVGGAACAAVAGKTVAGVRPRQPLVALCAGEPCGGDGDDGGAGLEFRRLGDVAHRSIGSRRVQADGRAGGDCGVLPVFDLAAAQTIATHAGYVQTRAAGDVRGGGDARTGAGAVARREYVGRQARRAVTGPYRGEPDPRFLRDLQRGPRATGAYHAAWTHLACAAAVPRPAEPRRNRRGDRP